MALPEKVDKKTKIITPVFRVSYPHLWTPQKSEDGESDVYSVRMIFEPGADLKQMKQLAKKIRDAKFGESGKFKKTFKDGNEEDLKKNPECTDAIIVDARSYNRPITVSKRNPAVKQGQKGWLIPITDRNEFYPGCYAVATVTCYTFDKKGNKGVSFGLSSITKVRNGEPLVSIANPEEDFAEMDTELFEDDDIDNAELLDSDDFDL